MNNHYLNIGDNFYICTVSMQKDKNEKWSIASDIKMLIKSQEIKRVPSYANTFFYSLGFYIILCFLILVVTGITMVFFGINWWNLNPTGVFIRSIHLWAASAFAIFLFLHLFTVFATSGFRDTKKLVWVLGSIMLMLVIFQMAFGLGIRGDLLSQFNDLSAADLWNGLLLGNLINPLNMGAVFAWHTAIVPLLLVFLIFVHYSLVRAKGISKPYRKEVIYKMIDFDHKKMFIRAGAIVVIIIAFAIIWRAPYITPVTIQQVAQSDPNMIASTLVQEFNHSSGTATYSPDLISVDPYTFNTRQVYVLTPFEQSLESNPSITNFTAIFDSENSTLQSNNINSAYVYFANNGTINASNKSQNPLIGLFSQLTIMAKSGLYESSLMLQSSSPMDQTYELRFLADSGAMNAAATAAGIELNQWGMLKDTNGLWPVGPWWTFPYNFADLTIFNNDPNQDFDTGLLALMLVILFISFPFIPGLNKLPDKLGLYKLYWGKYIKKARGRSRK